jgi:hypothetical protein
MDIGSELIDAQLEIKATDRTSDATQLGKLEFSKASDCMIVQLSSKIQKVLDGFVGDVKYSMLTETQMQDEYGDDWILADGGDVTGSKYEALTGNSTVPDLRGVFIRGKNNSREDGNENPAGENDLGDFENDTTRTPRNTAFTTNSDTHSHTFTKRYGSESSGGSYVWSINGSSSSSQSTSSDTHSHSITGGGDDETRPKNVTLNAFIKIN